ncbi:hypothetical protein MASR2M69_06130 [Bacteroidota bacterium]
MPPKDFYITVIDESTQLPLPKVEVYLNGPEDKSIGLTDEMGKIVFLWDTYLLIIL